MINEFLKQIIELDNQTEAAFEQIDVDVQRIKDETNKEIREKEVQILDKAKTDGQKTYDQAIQKAETEKEQMLLEATEESKKILKRYEEVREDMTNTVIETLFLTED